MMLMFTPIVNANSINSITMDIYIDGSGDAQVTEVWKCTTSQGTESYHPYYNLGESEITNLQVKDEDGITYQSLSYWNVNGSFNNKKYKCGINQISEGVELCWGISEYGSKTYTVSYEISNFVIELSDSQMTYWTLIPHNFSNTIGNVEITVRADKRFEDTLDVWGYGEYGAPAYVYDGVVKMHSDGSMTSDEYKVLLIKFPAGTFNTSVSLNNNFDYYLNMADEGSVKYVDENDSDYNYEYEEPSFFEKIIIGIIEILMFYLPFIFIGGIAVFVASFVEYVEIPKEQRKMIKDAPYYRDIPCDKNIFKMFYVAHTTGLMKRKTDVMGAVILKWLKEKKISIRKEETGIFKNKEETCVILDSSIASEIANTYEQKLYLLMHEASKDGVLEKKELEKWCSRNYQTILGWFDKVLAEEKENLLGDYSLYKSEEGKILKKKRIHFTDNLIQEAINISGLKKYLNDYTLINKREAIEVELFEEYLMFAQLVGIADKVAKEFKDLYPEVIEASSYQSYDNIIFLNTTMHRGIISANTAKSRAESYSSGGGGFSSGGGGGGSFGGGRRRRWRFPLIPIATSSKLERMI